MGTSGWSYDDWDGVFYPPAVASTRRLEHYVTRFPTVEVNSTHYALPEPATVGHWVEALGRAGSRWDQVEASLKAPRGVTHENRPAAEIGKEAAAFWARCGEPLAGKGLLGAVLLQYPPWFPEVPARADRAREALESGEAYASLIERIETAAGELSGARLAVEIRNKKGLDPETGEPPRAFLDVLRRMGASLVAVDAPAFPPLFVATGPEAYLRLHGRNRDIWDEPGSGASDWGTRVAPSDGRLSRYDYLYSEPELRSWVRRIQELTRRVDTVRVYFNNHPAGNAPQNAAQLASLLGLPAPEASGGQQRLPGDA